MRKKKQLEGNIKDLATTKTKEPRVFAAIPEIDIITQWQSPKVIIYRKGNNTTNIRFVDEQGIIKDSVFFSDNMVSISSIIMDSLRFGNDIHPELILHWNAYGSHRFSPTKGGWEMKIEGIDIWNLNNFKNIYSTLISEHTKSETEHQLPNDSSYISTEVIDKVNFFSIDTAKKLIKLEKIGKPYKIEIHRYFNDKFIEEN